MKSIEKKIAGSYEPIVQLTDGKKQGLVDYVKSLAGETVGNVGDVVDAIHISDSVASSAVTAATFAFSKASPPAKVLHFPTLEELGFDSADYEMKALLIANCRTNNPDKDVQLRVVNSAGEEVTGSVQDATLNNDTADQIVKTATPFSVTPGGAYAIDIRLITAGGGDNAVLQSKSFLVQIVKKSA